MELTNLWSWKGLHYACGCSISESDLWKASTLGRKEIGRLWIHRAWVVIMSEKTIDSQVHVSLLNIWRLCVSKIKFEGWFCSLTNEWALNRKFKSIFVHHSSHNWFHHTIEDVISNKVNRVFNDNNGYLHNLMHEESHKDIIMIEVTLSYTKLATVDLGSEVASISHMQVSLEVKIKIFQLKLHLAIWGVQPGVYCLGCLNVPLFDCWEVYFEIVLSIAL